MQNLEQKQRNTLACDQGKLAFWHGRSGSAGVAWSCLSYWTVFKKGNRLYPGNYRPISLTSIACKILEHVITSCIINYFERNKILTDCQHGFRKRRSCETQLIMTVEDLARGLNEKRHPPVLFEGVRQAATSTTTP